MTAIAFGLGSAIVVGLIVLWPGAVEIPQEADVLRRGDIVHATVTLIERGPCGSAGEPAAPDAGGPTCRRFTLQIDEGDDEGRNTVLELPDLETSPDLQVDEQVLLERPPVEVPGAPYAFYDRIRTPSLFWLALVFAVLVVLLGRLKGLAALIGLAISIALLLVFIIPAILNGSPPVMVASVGAGAIAFVVLYVAHGFTSRTTVALIGTLAGVGLTLVLSLVWVPFAHLAGLATEGSYIIQAVGVEVDLSGLLLAGIVIGALGAIDDVAVTQASAVWELRAADPELGPRELRRAGMRVGRDHVGSIVNTLALAYAGASLPLLILFQLSRQPLGSLVGSEVVATEIVRTLVGSMGLIAAMPVTTWLASRIAPTEPPDEPGLLGH
ncbi:MAG TPA: YibE/F family protein [Actinomycetota bacterium]